MSNDYKANIESILLGYYIKYINLEELTANTIVVSEFANSDNIDIYIDLYDMLKNLYSIDIYSNKQFIIVSSVINLVAHMREFYWSRYRVNSRIYLVYGSEESNNHKQFYLNFGESKIKEKRNYDKINSVVQSQLDMIKILCAYIYNVYYVRKSTDFCMFTYDNICKNASTPSVILTKSKYAYQIPALCKNAFLLRPKKIKGQDVSFVITSSNVLFAYCNKINNDNTLLRLKDINPKLLSLIISLNGLPSKNLLTLFNITTAVGKVWQLIKDNIIINDYNSDIDYVYNKLQIDNKIDLFNFKYRFNAVDLVFQHRLYSLMPESKDTSWLINLSDPDTVKNINNTYFIDNPLDLNSL